MAEEALKTLPFAQPTQCRRYEGRVAILTGAAQVLGLVIQALSSFDAKRIGSARPTSPCTKAAGLQVACLR